MALDAAAALQAVYDLVRLVPNLQGCTIGVPKSIAKKVSGYVTLGGQTAHRQRLGRGPTRLREVRLYIGLVYRIADDEGDAEMILAGIVDEIVARLDADQTLGGVVDDVKLDFTLGDAPQYALWLGQEFRTYPIVIAATQMQS